MPRSSRGSCSSGSSHSHSRSSRGGSHSHSFSGRSGRSSFSSGSSSGSSFNLYGGSSYRIQRRTHIITSYPFDNSRKFVYYRDNQPIYVYSNVDLTQQPDVRPRFWILLLYIPFVLAFGLLSITDSGFLRFIIPVSIFLIVHAIFMVFAGTNREYSNSELQEVFEGPGSASEQTYNDYTPSDAPQTNYCPRCGEKYIIGYSEYCPNCGALLPNSELKF